MQKRKYRNDPKKIVTIMYKKEKDVLKEEKDILLTKNNNYFRTKV